MSQRPLLITEHSPSYWRVTFDSPPLNLVGSAMLLGLHDVVECLDANPELKVVVFDNALDDYFLGHYHLKEEGAQPLPTYESGLTALPDFTTRVARAPYLSIAAIRGRVRAVGSEIALGADLRFASKERAIFSQPEVGLGVIPGGGALGRMPQLMGRARTSEVVLGADDYDAETAERYGWINRAIPDAELDDFVDAYARRVASFDRQAVATAKTLVNERVGLTTGDELKETQTAFYQVLSGPAAQQRAAAAFALGLQTPGDFERDLGRRVVELS